VTGPRLGLELALVVLGLHQIVYRAVAGFELVRDFLVRHPTGVGSQNVDDAVDQEVGRRRFAGLEKPEEEHICVTGPRLGLELALVVLGLHQIVYRAVAGFELVRDFLVRHPTGVGSQNVDDAVDQEVGRRRQLGSFFEECHEAVVDVRATPPVLITAPRPQQRHQHGLGELASLLGFHPERLRELTDVEVV